MSTGDRAQSYAGAFYEAAFERWLTTMETVAESLGRNRALLERLQADDVAFTERQAALDGIIPAGADVLVRNLLHTLLQHNDLPLLGDVAEMLRARMQSAVAEPIPVEVVTAVALAAEQRRALEVKLEAQHGAGLAYSYRVDPSILGGMVVRVGDKLIDGSVVSRLAAMRQALGVTGNE